MRTFKIIALVFLALIPVTILADDPILVMVYPGFGTNRGFVVEGRVIEKRSVRPEQTDDGKMANLWRAMQRMINDESAGVALLVQIGARTWKATSDKEGYFRVESEAPELTEGWLPVTARTSNGEVGEGGLLLVSANNTIGIISDLDDTILVSDVNHKTRLLKNSLLKNARQREAVTGMADWYRRILSANPQPEAAPMFYLTASPRQLYDGIDLFLRENKFPTGVVISKKVTGRSDGDPITDQVAYKIAKIEEILARVPGVKFVLVGDDGERDPEIYRAVRDRHGERIEAVWIRRVFPDPGRARYTDQGDVEEALNHRADAR